MRDIFIVALCLLVFSLASSAKIAAYRDPGKTSCDPVANTKLCLSGAKMDMQSTAAPLLVFWFASFTVCAAFDARRRMTSALPLLVVPARRLEYRIERYLRPPPATFHSQF